MGGRLSKKDWWGKWLGNEEDKSGEWGLLGLPHDLGVFPFRGLVILSVRFGAGASEIQPFWRFGEVELRVMRSASDSSIKPSWRVSK